MKKRRVVFQNIFFKTPYNNGKGGLQSPSGMPVHCTLMCALLIGQLLFDVLCK
jgi:hypothetical protein